MNFRNLLSKARGAEYAPPVRLLCLDPGETTGWALFTDGELTDWGQLDTYDKEEKSINWGVLSELFKTSWPHNVVCENYRVYQHKLDTHANSEVITLRLIGGIDMLCHMRNVPITYQMAQMAKGFSTDKKLKTWGYWKEGMRHSRDAIRHGCYYLLFNKEAGK